MIVPTFVCCKRDLLDPQWVKFCRAFKYLPHGWAIEVGPRLNAPRYQHDLFRVVPIMDYPS